MTTEQKERERESTKAGMDRNMGDSMRPFLSFSLHYISNDVQKEDIGLFFGEAENLANVSKKKIFSDKVYKSDFRC